MSEYKYESFEDVIDAFIIGELEDFRLDVDNKWVMLMRKDTNSAMKEDLNLWKGDDPANILLGIMASIGVPTNE